MNDKTQQQDPQLVVTLRKNALIKVVGLVIEELGSNDKSPITKNQSLISEQAIFGEIIHDINSVLSSEAGGYNIPNYKRGGGGSFEASELLKILKIELNKLIENQIVNENELEKVLTDLKDKIRSLLNL